VLINKFKQVCHIHPLPSEALNFKQIKNPDNFSSGFLKSVNDKS